MLDTSNPSSSQWSHSSQQRWTLAVPARPQTASQVRVFVRDHARTAGFDENAIAEIEVAVGEAITNAILYGHFNKEEGAGSGTAPITVVVGLERLRGDSAIFYVEVRDAGPGFDPAQTHPTEPGDADPVGGRGLPLIDALMDRVHFQRGDAGGMCVRMERRLPVFA